MLRAGIIFCLLGTAVSVTAQPKPTTPVILPDQEILGDIGWKAVVKPNGTRLSLPIDYEVHSFDQGRIQVIGDQGCLGITTSYVLVHPFVAHTGETAEQYIKRMVLPRFKSLSDCLVERKESSSPDRSSFQVRYALREVPRTALVHCTKKGRAGMTYILAGPVKGFTEKRKSLARIAMSVRYGIFPKAPQPDPLGGVDFFTWEEPGEKAFSLEVPTGWQVTGKIIRRSPLDWQPVVNLTAPNKTISINLNDRKCALFLEPEPHLVVSGFHEGRWYSTSENQTVHVLTYRPGYTFISEYLLADTTAITGLQLLKKGALPPLKKTLDSLLKGRGKKRELNAGELIYTARKNKQLVTGYGLCVTQKWHRTADPSHWSILGLCGWQSRPGGEDEADAILRRALATFRINHRWAALQPGLTKEEANALSQVFREIGKTLAPSYKKRVRILEDTVGPLPKEKVLRDSQTGEIFKAARGHNYYWRRVDAPGKEGRNTQLLPDLDLSPLLEF